MFWGELGFEVGGGGGGVFFWGMLVGVGVIGCGDFATGGMLVGRGKGVVKFLEWLVGGIKQGVGGMRERVGLASSLHWLAIS